MPSPVARRLERTPGGTATSGCAPATHRQECLCYLLPAVEGKEEISQVLRRRRIFKRLVPITTYESRNPSPGSLKSCACRVQL
jgi:hypothetical protein